MVLIMSWLLTVYVMPDEAAELPLANSKSVVIAHRGEHLHHHENTLEAIQGAIDAGADFTEMDVRRSSDGHYFILHDRTADRMTDGHGNVADMTWAELQALVVRDKSLTNVPPSRIPSFEEALQACKGKICVYVDFKNGNRAVVADIIRANGMARNVIVYDENSGIREWRSAAPELPIITSPPRNSATDLKVLNAFVERFRPNALDQLPAPEKVEAARNLESLVSNKVQYWIDVQRSDEGPEYWQGFWDKKVRGFQTDHPREMVQWLRKQHQHD